MKVYPVSRHRLPPRNPKPGYKWVKKTASYEVEISVPSVKIYRRKRYKRRRKYYFRRIYQYTRKGYSYIRRYKVKAWVQVPVEIIREDWRVIDEYLLKIERRLKKKYHIKVVRGLSRPEKYYRIADPYASWIELNTTLLWKVRKLPVKWLFDVYFMYYYARVREDDSKGKYVIIFQSNSFKADRKMSIFDLYKYEIPKAIAGVEKDMKRSKKDVQFIEYACFSATTKAIIRKTKKHLFIDYGADVWHNPVE
jgi:hypothetical protein